VSVLLALHDENVTSFFVDGCKLMPSSSNSLPKAPSCPLATSNDQGFWRDVLVVLPAFYMGMM